MMKNTVERRGLLAVLGGALGAFAIGTRRVAAQAATTFQPARHDQDAWLDKMPGKHRIVIDVTTAAGVPDAIRFAGNIYEGSRTAYDLAESDIAMVVILRHSATAFGYNDTIWGKHAKSLVNATSYTNPRDPELPKGNPYNSAPRNQLDGLVKRGVQFMVCGTASRGISRSLAGQGGDAEATFKEMAANLIPNARIVPAGVIGVTRAQEYGFSAIHAG
jgi:intracellular sulfur oxidation DsrE/DsrF family protein